MQSHSFRSADHTIHMFDRRNLSSDGVGLPVRKFAGHTSAVLCVQVLHSPLLIIFLSDYACLIYLFT